MWSGGCAIVAVLLRAGPGRLEAAAPMAFQQLSRLVLLARGTKSRTVTHFHKLRTRWCGAHHQTYSRTDFGNMFGRSILWQFVIRRTSRRAPGYFGKPARDLDLASALIGGADSIPGRLRLCEIPEAARARQRSSSNSRQT